MVVNVTSELTFLSRLKIVRFSRLRNGASNHAIIVSVSIDWP